MLTFDERIVPKVQDRDGDARAYLPAAGLRSNVWLSIKKILVLGEVGIIYPR
jgi:hypothetical protein